MQTSNFKLYFHGQCHRLHHFELYWSSKRNQNLSTIQTFTGCTVPVLDNRFYLLDFKGKVFDQAVTRKFIPKLKVSLAFLSPFSRLHLSVPDRIPSTCGSLRQRRQRLKKLYQVFSLLHDWVLLWVRGVFGCPSYHCYNASVIHTQSTKSTPLVIVSRS